MAEAEDRDWQRLDKWLWCARVSKTRAACARLVEEGGVRINRQPTDKPHARLRPGDVLKSIDGLCAEVQRRFGEDPMGGHLLVFFNRDRTGMKALIWDNGGFIVVYKRLERGRFVVPPVRGDRMTMTHAELAARRPSTAHLTVFYIVVATGGALGGLLNGILGFVQEAKAANAVAALARIAWAARCRANAIASWRSSWRRSSSR